MPATDRPSDEGRGRTPRRGDDLTEQLHALEDEVESLRRRLTDSPRHTRALEERETVRQRLFAPPVPPRPEQAMGEPRSALGE